MKASFFTLTLLLGISLGSFAKTENRTVHKQTGKYAVDKTHPSIALPTNFGKPFIIDKSNLNKLYKNEIYQIDLIYTQYRSSDSFDQAKLNQNRVDQLKKLMSTIDKDLPTWNYIEQTSAIDCETAKTYFHGFVIHYKPESIDHNALKSKFQSFQSQSETYQLNNAEAKEFTYSSGTKIHVPKNAVTYKNGSLVKGDYQITYCEFRTPADIAFSGIPMKYEVDGVNANFSSIGMYEIRGTQNGKELLLNKPITVDFNCTKVVDDASFFSLIDESGEWKLIKPIKKEDFGREIKLEFEVNERGVAANTIVVVSEDIEMPTDRNQKAINWKTMKIKSKVLSKDSVALILDKHAWKNYLKINTEPEMKSMIIGVKEQEKTVYVAFKNADVFKYSVRVGKYTPFDNNLGVVRGNNVKDNGNRTKNTMIGSGAASHTYPTIVRGLQSSKFGVYNCDQIYNIGKTMTLHPLYIDAVTEKVIDSPDVTCLMDMTYNGSFSFDPEYITLNPKGKNALLLFTINKEMYLVLPHQFNLGELDPKHPTIKMYNVTEKVKSSKDLQALLNS